MLWLLPLLSERNTEYIDWLFSWLLVKVTDKFGRFVRVPSMLHLRHLGLLLFGLLYLVTTTLDLMNDPRSKLPPVLRSSDLFG
jgi:hypothetical protein